MPLFRKRFQPQGKFCYVTGGSAGLGKALAIYLVKHGAHVTIVARDAKKLGETETLLKGLTVNSTQLVHSISADLTSAESSNSALDTAMEHHGGRAPDYALLCAGFSKPKFFIDATTADLQAGLDGTFWVQAWTAHAAAKAMIANRVKGSIVLVSSFLGYSTFAGYSTYSPGKYALRGLADTLRNEMLLHDISVHIFMPAGIDSAGYISEQEFKPACTKKLEEGDKVISAEDCAGHLIRGLERGYYQPTTYFITDLMRLQSRGGVPGNNPFMDIIWWFLSSIGIPIWVFFMDRTVSGFKKDVQRDLETRGYYKKPAGSGSM